MSAAIAYDDWAPGRFRQMDTAFGCTGPGTGVLWDGVYLSEPVQTHCTAEDPSRQHPCLSVSIVSDPLLAEPN